MECRSKEVDKNGMVVDFSHIKRMIKERVDHKMLNEVLNFNPTAENIARWVVDSVPNCYRAQVEESSGNWAAYEKED